MNWTFVHFCTNDEATAESLANLLRGAGWKVVSSMRTCPPDRRQEKFFTAILQMQKPQRKEPHENPPNAG